MNEINHSCPECHAEVRQHDQYCASCGARLGSQRHVVEKYLEELLPGRVDALLKDRFKDQNVVAVETSELVATRAIGWLKILGFLIGIPAACVVGLITFVGIKNYADLERIENQLSDPAAHLSTLKNDIASLETGAASVQGQIERLNFQVCTLLTDQQKSKVKAVIEQFAIGSYGHVLPARNKDVQFGLDGWSMVDSSDFSSMLISYGNNPSAKLGNQLRPYLQRVKARDVTLSTDQPFLELLAKTGDDHVMQKIEDAALDANLDDDMALPRKLGLQLPLSIAIVVHAVSWLGQDVVDEDAKANPHATGCGVNERAWTEKLLSRLEEKHRSPDLQRVFSYYRGLIAKDQWALDNT